MRLVARNSYCHWCGAKFSPENLDKWPRGCSHCENVAYKNPTPVSVVIVPVKKHIFARKGVLVIRRGGGVENPGSGQLAFPGGFQDTKECSSRAGVREALEEVGICLSHNDLRLLHVEYAEKPDVQIIFWEAKTISLNACDGFVPNAEVSEIVIVHSSDVKLAFSSHQNALRLYFSRWHAFQQMCRYLLQVLRF